MYWNSFKKADTMYTDLHSHLCGELWLNKVWHKAILNHELYLNKDTLAEGYTLQRNLINMVYFWTLTSNWQICFEHNISWKCTLRHKKVLLVTPPNTEEGWEHNCLQHQSDECEHVFVVVLEEILSGFGVYRLFQQ